MKYVDLGFNTGRQMPLLTMAICKQMPPLYATDKIPLAKKVIQVKYFAPAGAATWIVFEGSWLDGEQYNPLSQITKDLLFDANLDVMFFGYVTLDGQFWEMGNFSLQELYAPARVLRSTFRGFNDHLRHSPIERDLHFSYRTWGEYAEKRGIE